MRRPCAVLPLLALSCTPQQALPIARSAAPAQANNGSPTSTVAAPDRGTSPREPTPGAPVVLPTEFVANRIFVTPVMQDGRALRLYTDSGGGAQFLFDDSVSRLGLPVRTIPGDEAPLRVTPIPAWAGDAFLPPPLAIHRPAVFQTSYLVSKERFLNEGTDGFLGQGWFGGRVWTFDYAAKRLSWRAPGDLPSHASGEEIRIHFPLADDGLPSMSFGRISIQVDGEDFDVLFDTGATTQLTTEALATIADGGPAVRATSFITKSVLERWRARHPDWRFVDKAEWKTGAAMLEVPHISVASHEAGPVWFTLRPDTNFHDFMSGMMDARVEGALGGDALRYFRVTVDYPHGRAVFQQ